MFQAARFGTRFVSEPVCPPILAAARFPLGLESGAAVTCEALIVATAPVRSFWGSNPKSA